MDKLNSAHQRARAVFDKWYDDDANVDDDDCAITTGGDKALIDAIAAALEAERADVWEEAATRAGYIDRRIEEMFLKEAAAIRQRKGN